MGRALGWVVIVSLIVILGTHPSVMAGLIHHLLDLLKGAGNELAAFINSL
jgi:hypothetical protein